MSGVLPEWLGESLIMLNFTHSSGVDDVSGGGRCSLLFQAWWTLAEVEEGRHPIRMF